MPEPVALCTDRDVLGEPFYLMSFVDGLIVETPELVPDAGTARRTTELLVDTLVALHPIDPAAVGLADFGRPEGFLQRQVARWHKQFQASVPERRRARARRWSRAAAGSTSRPGPRPASCTATTG